MTFFGDNTTEDAKYSATKFKPFYVDGDRKTYHILVQKGEAYQRKNEHEDFRAALRSAKRKAGAEPKAWSLKATMGKETERENEKAKVKAKEKERKKEEGATAMVKSKANQTLQPKTKPKEDAAKPPRKTPPTSRGVARAKPHYVIDEVVWAQYGRDWWPAKIVADSGEVGLGKLNVLYYDEDAPSEHTHSKVQRWSERELQEVRKTTTLKGQLRTQWDRSVVKAIRDLDRSSSGGNASSARKPPTNPMQKGVRGRKHSAAAAEAAVTAEAEEADRSVLLAKQGNQKRGRSKSLLPGTDSENSYTSSDDGLDEAGPNRGERRFLPPTKRTKRITKSSTETTTKTVQKKSTVLRTVTTVEVVEFYESTANSMHGPASTDDDDDTNYHTERRDWNAGQH